MKIAIIINSSAGTNNNDEESAQIEAAFNRKDVDAVFFEVPGEKIKEAVAEAAKSGFDTITAVGGDGTLNSIINVISGTNIPLGIIPLGTLNHFAKDAGIPLDIDEAVEVIVKRNVKSVDVAEVNGHYFLNNSSVGLYPKMVKHRNKEMDVLGYGKWWAMFRALLNVFKKYPLIAFRIRTENHYNEIRIPFIFIGNNKYTIDMFKLGMRDRIDGGELSLYYPKTSGKFSMLRFAFMALINRLDSVEDFYNTTCREVRLNSYRRMLEVSADGEVLHFHPPLEYKLHPGKLQIIVPEGT
jgi:diacylglycerol kinase family enzyme